MKLINKETTQLDCMMCQRSANAKFTKSLHETPIIYYECCECGHLTASSFDPDQLYEKQAYFTEVDHGWEARNKRIIHFIKFFARVPGINLSLGIEILDYGCGVGSLVDDLSAEGYAAYGYEPFPNPEMRSQRVITEWHTLKKEGKQPQLVTMIEVIEHLREPEKQLADIRQILKPQGYVLVSTGIFRDDVHDSSWFYLNPYAGHVSIYSEDSICTLLKRYNLQPIFRINENLWLFRKVEKRTLLEKLIFWASDRRVQAKYRKGKE